MAPVGGSRHEAPHENDDGTIRRAPVLRHFAACAGAGLGADSIGAGAPDGDSRRFRHQPDLSLERYLGIWARVAVPSIEWVVFDCGGGGDGRERSICVEGRAPTAPGLTVAVAVRVLGSGGQPGTPTLHQLSVIERNVPVFAASLQELGRLALRRAREAQAQRREPTPVSSGEITEIMLERTWSPLFAVGAAAIETQAQD